jgi:hypothetical protein
MATQDNVTQFFPAPLVRIVLVAIPVFVVCFFSAGLKDHHSEPGTMSADAIRARLEPVAGLAIEPPTPAPEVAAAKPASPSKPSRPAAR